MLKSRKHVFWEALLATILIFSLGLILGVAFENSRQDKINSYYEISQLSLMDMMNLGEIVSIDQNSCDDLISSSLNFADRIYEEARLLEDYGKAERLTEESELTHKRYDLLRTLLWINSLKVQRKCGDNFSTVVYLYNYKTQDIEEKATQVVWSRLLQDLKEEKGKDIVLIPIAVDSELASLDTLLQGFDIPKYPAVIINEVYVITEIESVADLEKYFD
jgi:hypothetical protein